MLGIKVKDIVSDKRVPLASSKDTLAHIRNLLVRYKAPIVLITDDKKVIGRISIKDLALAIIRNIRQIRILDSMYAEDIMSEIGEIPSIEADVKDIIPLILEKRDVIPVLNHKTGEYLFIEAEDILGIFPDVYDKEINVSKVCSKEVLTATPSQSIIQLYKKMREKGYDSIIVTDIVKRPIGIITYRDIVNHPPTKIKKNKYVLKDEEGRIISSEDKYPTAQEIMSGDLFFLFKNENLKKASIEMSTRRIGHLPVVEEDLTLYGLLNKYDIISLL